MCDLCNVFIQRSFLFNCLQASVYTRMLLSQKALGTHTNIIVTYLPLNRYILTWINVGTYLTYLFINPTLTYVSNLQIWLSTRSFNYVCLFRKVFNWIPVSTYKTNRSAPSLGQGDLHWTLESPLRLGYQVQVLKKKILTFRLNLLSELKEQKCLLTYLNR